ncbi:NmrA family NAD(P)-binding protein [Lichenicoccus sp.]|uniref:NmrA family NAD(P)-binding protein n=1 Tax=Lichenicoccus sp. TaxID=2781899 RepID=UPI003D0E757B
MVDDAGSTLVVGAAGRFAGLVVPALASRGVHPLALVRTVEGAEKARANGAGDTVLGDLRDRPGLEAALRGVERAFYISPVFQEDEAEMGVGFVEAARQAGVRRIVFSTIIHPSLDLTNHASKRPIEAALLKSGLDYTLLRPAVLYQNLAAGWPKLVESGVLAEPFSTISPIARVDYRDVAEVSAIALTEDRLLNGTFELSADGGMNREAVAAIAGQVSGRRIKAVAADFEDWFAKAHLPYDDQQKQQLAAMYAHYDQHGLRSNPFTLRAILGREPRSLHAFFADLVASKAALGS